VSLHIVVVGAGIAGLATALACAQAGALVQVLEARAAVPQVPAHIDLVPSLLRDLSRLGAAEACVRRGFAYNELAVVDEHGDEGLRLPTPRLVGPQLPPAAGIALDELLAVLAEAAVRAGATLQRGCVVRSIEPDAGHVLADGQVFEADLIVLAAGADSPLVASLFGPLRGGATRHAWWHALLPRPAGLDRSTWMAGSLGRRLLLVPIGMSRAGVAVVGTMALDGPADGRALAQLLGSWGALPRRIAEMIEPTAPTALRHVASALRDPPWHRGAVLCVGAAAHAIAPPFGQAAAQALEDAVVLGELVAAGLERSLLLQRFMHRRAGRVQRLTALTERAAHWMLHPEPATDLARIAGEIGALVAEPA
jgi:2-polyprenyl-6-methoxyphenol hydroxylase-like FAD-dependent oxidoreductase